MYTGALSAARCCFCCSAAAPYVIYASSRRRQKTRCVMPRSNASLAGSRSDLDQSVLVANEVIKYDTLSRFNETHSTKPLNRTRTPLLTRLLYDDRHQVIIYSFTNTDHSARKGSYQECQLVFKSINRGLRDCPALLHQQQSFEAAPSYCCRLSVPGIPYY